ncbi:MAG: tetratricopeptide repeat protein [Bacteroidetes bacterium]|nr:MAG: tetratricopeptide repeat protein [Bacteroidota bacterium]
MWKLINNFYMTTPLKHTRTILFIFLVFYFHNAHAAVQDKQKELQDRIYNSFVEGNLNSWELTITEMENLYRTNPRPDFLYDLLLARYGFIAANLGEGEKSKARAHLDKAEEELERLFVYTIHKSNAYALQGAFLGFRISLRPLSAIRLGPRSYRAIDNALEADENNPAAWMEKGNTRFYTPSTFGGSKEEARDAYKKAVELFEKNLQNNQRWLYLNSLIGLAKSYQYTDQNALAIATFEKALRFEPGLTWVRDELLPEARSRR